MSETKEKYSLLQGRDSIVSTSTERRDVTPTSNKGSCDAVFAEKKTCVRLSYCITLDKDRCPDFFFIFLHENICCGYLFEATRLVKHF